MLMRASACLCGARQADDAFEGFDLTDLEDDSGAFDLSRGVWRQGPWQELDALRKKLEARTAHASGRRKETLSARRFFPAPLRARAFRACAV